VKRLAYECPITHIADVFYILLREFVEEPLAEVVLKEDPISTFFDLSECPKVLDLPIDFNP